MSHNRLLFPHFPHVTTKRKTVRCYYMWHILLNRVNHELLIRTVDTDIVVLAVMVAQKLPAIDQLWFAFGTGKKFWYLAAHELAVNLWPDKSLALPMFHALTRCVSMSAFYGHGKRTAWVTWNLLPELTSAL